MKLRLLALPLAALFLAACSQDPMTPTPDATLGASGAALDTYVIDFEDAPTSGENKLNLIWDVAVGRGVKYEGEGVAITDKIRIDGYTMNKGKKVGGNSALVIATDEKEMGKALFVFPRSGKFQGTQLEIKPSQAFGGPSKGKNGLVTLKGITVYMPGNTSGNIVLYGNGKFIKKIPLNRVGMQTLELDEPGVGFIQVNTSSLVAVDDVVFEVPSKEDDFVGKEIVGNWEGSASQAGFGSYSINVAITKDPNANQVSAKVTYPSLSCGGDWTFKSAEGSKYTFAEQITSGTNNCVVSSDVNVTYNQDDSLTYDWQYYGSSATGTLNRVK